VVAEGIENREQMEMLKHFGCELGQGYLFSRPVAADMVVQLLASQHAAREGLDQGSTVPHSFPR